ncbi:ATP-binding cassette domain-containing protein [Yinghuangia aomiensis]
MPAELLRVHDLAVEFPAKRRRQPARRVLDGITFDVRPAETLGLVGESGSGKSTIGRMILGLVRPTAGTVTFDGHDITHGRPPTAPRREHRHSGRLPGPLHLAQPDHDPSATPSPNCCALAATTAPTPTNASPHSSTGFTSLPTPRARLPREFSGGQRQRIAIARALALQPRLIVCDEPVSALDMSTQATVLSLFIELQETLGIAYLFISHDLDVIRHISHRVAVLRHGEIAELGNADTVTSTPQHPYTQRLLMASPIANPERQAERRRMLQQLKADHAALA